MYIYIEKDLFRQNYTYYTSLRCNLFLDWFPAVYSFQKTIHELYTNPTQTIHTN